MSSVLEHAHTHTTFRNAVVSGRAAVDHVRVEGDPVADMVPLPSDCLPIPGSKGMAGDPFFVRYYVDYGILAEVQFFPDGRRCMRAIPSLASDHFRLLSSVSQTNSLYWKHENYWVVYEARGVGMDH